MAVFYVTATAALLGAAGRWGKKLGVGGHCLWCGNKTDKTDDANPLHNT